MADLQLTGVVPAGAASGLAGSVVASTSPASAGDAGLAAAQRAKSPSQTAAVGTGRESDGKTSGAVPSEGQVKAAVGGANQALAANGTQLVFVFDDQTQHMAVKLLDIQTQKVVQEILPKAMLDAANALSGSSSSGVLVDTKA